MTRTVRGILAALLLSAVQTSAQEIDATKIYLAAGPTVLAGSGSPEGVVPASPGSLYLRADAGDVYRKASGAGTTGWVSFLSGTGTTNTLTKWTGASSLGNSMITESGTTITIGGGGGSASIATPAATDLTLAPTGDQLFNPAGKDILPTSGYDLHLGSLQKKYLTLHAAELWVETLVAQNTIATIGGRVLVAPTNLLSVDLGDGVADTTITVKYNNLANGDRVYMEAAGKVEFMAVTSAPGGSAGAYTYSVTRNLDGSGLNLWYAGDAVLNTGQTGNGFIDLYSVRGIKASTEVGPTIVGNVRLSATYNDWSPRWAIGNLNGLYGYGADTYGVALGVPTAAHVLIDPTNGIRIRHNTTNKIVLDASGNASFTGSITAASGTIGSWTIAADRIQAGGPSNLLRLISGGAQVARVEVGTGTDTSTSGINSAGAAASTEISFWSGSTHANRATAPFRVNLAGALVASNATIAGSITASSGTIGGFTITSDRLQTVGAGGRFIVLVTDEGLTMSDAVAHNVGMHIGSGGSDIAFFAGGTVKASSPYRVTYAGALTATNATITGAITATSGSFTGSITSSSGTIGGWTIGSTSLSATNVSLTSGAANTAHVLVGTGTTAGGLNSANAGSDITIWSGSTHANRATAPFRVEADGSFAATDANITGTIDANAGTIGALTVDGTLTIGSGGQISVGTNGSIAGGATSFTVGTGFWLENTKFRVGSPLNYFAWDGAGLLISGKSLILNGTILELYANLQVMDQFIVNNAADFNSTIEINAIGSDTGTGLVRNASGLMKVDSSSTRYKQHILPWRPSDPKAILGATPIQFDFINGTRDVLGFSAEALHAIDPRLVNLDAEGRPDSVRTQAMLAYLVVAVQELHARMAVLEKQ